MTISFTSDVSNINGQTVGAGASEQFTGSGTFTFVAGTSSFSITAAELQGGDTSNYTLGFTLTTLTGDSQSTTLSSRAISYTVTYVNDNDPETTENNPVSAVFSTGNYLASGAPTGSNGDVFATTVFNVTGTAGFQSNNGTGSRIWASKAERNRYWNQGHI